MSVLRFYRNYNNYSNNIQKHSSSILDFVGYDYTELNNTNFNPNDDITTTHVVNWSNSWTPDYMIVLNENEILSRWFVTESIRTRGKQYKFTLRRDIIDDKYDLIINAPMLINRAIINNVNNPLLYNSEGFSFNQIKKEEILLKDATNSAWYILYFKKGLASKTFTFNPKPGIEDHTITTPISQSIFAGPNLYQTSNIIPMISYRDYGMWGTEYRLAIEPNRLDFYKQWLDADCIWFDQGQGTIKSQLTSAFSNMYDSLKHDVLVDNDFTQVSSADEEYLSWDDKLVKDANNNLYRVHVNKHVYSRWKYVTNGDMVSHMKTAINHTSLTRTGDWGEGAFAVKYNNIEYSFSYTPETDPNQFNITVATSSLGTRNSDYDIIAIPYSDITIKDSNNITKTIPQEWSRALLKILMTDEEDPQTHTHSGYVADSELVDIQLLPYFPIVKGQSSPINNLDVSEYNYVQDSEDTSKGICLFYISDSNFTFNYNVSDVLTTSNDYKLRKIQNETQTVRLCSPNYNGVFEFNVAKNGGVDFLNIDITLKPYNPYIHINPNFNNLYGQDFNDARGLICGGDFSIPMWSTAWQQYQLNNKNYKNIFDRQIENLEFTQGQESTQAYWNLLTGTVTGAGAGAMAGGMAGGPWGAAIGGAVGGLTSMAGGFADLSMLQSRQTEQKNLTYDMFKFQLGNIKALPYSLNKVTPLTFNNKIFPFIEIYECTEQERTLFGNFLDYQSMTVNTIGTISEYKLNTQRTFIQGKMLRLENSDLCSHEWLEIYYRLQEGVYI